MGTHVLQSEMRARHGHPSSASDTVCVCVWEGGAQSNRGGPEPEGGRARQAQGAINERAPPPTPVGMAAGRVKCG